MGHGGVMGCIKVAVISGVMGVVMCVFVLIPSPQREGSPFLEEHWTSKYRSEGVKNVDS